MGRHIAFFNIPATGHVTPTLGVVEELVRRGHRVTYAATAEYADTVAAAGATVLPYESVLDPGTIAPTGARDWLARVLLGAVREAEATAPVFDAHFAGDRPDLLAYDISAQFLGRVLSRKWERPGVQFYPVFASHQYFSDAEAEARGKFGEFQRALREFADRHGSHGVPFSRLMSDPEALKVVFLPREFQFDGDSFGADHTFVGLSLRERDLRGGWEPPASGHPVVLISLGTTYNRQPGFFRRCAEAFAGRPWHVVITAGPGVDLSAIGPLPDNVEVHPWLSLQSVLRHTRVFVCHGGPGTTMNALYAGVPLVVVPQNGDEEMVAARVAELGLGEALPPADATVERIRGAVLDVAGDPAAAEAAERMSKHIRDAGGAARAADAILAHLERSRRQQ